MPPELTKAACATHGMMSLQDFVEMAHRVKATEDIEELLDIASFVDGEGTPPSSEGTLQGLISKSHRDSSVPPSSDAFSPDTTIFQNPKRRSSP